MAAAGRVLAPRQRPRTSAQESPLIVSEEVWHGDYAQSHHRADQRQGGSCTAVRAELFGLAYEGLGEHFAPVKLNDDLTFLFDDDANFESHHYAFHVSDAEFDAIFGRVKEERLAYGSAPWSADDKKLNDWGGGRGVYFKTPDGHLLELMTVPQ